jgi:natural product precursor
MKQKIKVSLNSFRLDHKVMQKVKGGDCKCGCRYANSGGSSTDANHAENNKTGKHTPYPFPIPD